VSSRQPQYYGYAELADRIAAVLGVRPSLSLLRGAAAEARRRDQRQGLRRGRPSITTGMPHPRPSTRRPATFDPLEVETWLAGHPALAWDQALQTARDRLADGQDVEDVVSAALQAGISWSALTELINAHQHTSWTKAWVHRRYRHLEPARPTPPAR